MEHQLKPRKSELYGIVRGVGTNSVEITIPKNIADLMEIKAGTRIEFDLSDRGYGKRLSLWNHKQQMKEYRRTVNKG